VLRRGTAGDMARAKTIFVGGTSSNAGKSWMATAICAWLRRRGFTVAPFKAQNMSNNSYPCRTGGEIGRAQVAQAEACGLEPEPAMNPILLKPSGNGRSQVVVDGRVWKTLTAREYYACADELRPHVVAAYRDLASRFDAVVIEGAGSVSELNLRQHDLVNLGLVTAIDAPWILVADIERGGVFGSIVGTLHLLAPGERALFRGFAINKFRGDVTLFDDGVRVIENRTASHCFGVFPYEESLHLDAEDSLAPATACRTQPQPGARTAIVRLPHLSNATDFRLLSWADWIASPQPDRYDFVILPGSKNTIADLEWLHRTGLADWIVEQHRRGARVIGICGGYQMLGKRVSDPSGIESDIPSLDGLGLLPTSTTLTREKRTRTVRGTTADGVVFAGYEIHVGVTTLEDGAQASSFARLDDGTSDGLSVDGVTGTYLHGALEDPDVCEEIFGVPVPRHAAKAAHYERLADWLEKHGRNLDRLGFN
jgi:adenosylcobyric acid synthase